MLYRYTHRNTHQRPGMSKSSMWHWANQIGGRTVLDKQMTPLHCGPPLLYITPTLSLIRRRAFRVQRGMRIYSLMHVNSQIYSMAMNKQLFTHNHSSHGKSNFFTKATKRISSRVQPPKWRGLWNKFWILLVCMHGSRVQVFLKMNKMTISVLKLKEEKSPICDKYNSVKGYNVWWML